MYLFCARHAALLNVLMIWNHCHVNRILMDFVLKGLSNLWFSFVNLAIARLCHYDFYELKAFLILFVSVCLYLSVCLSVCLFCLFCFGLFVCSFLCLFLQNLDRNRVPWPFIALNCLCPLEDFPVCSTNMHLRQWPSDLTILCCNVSSGLNRLPGFNSQLVGGWPTPLKISVSWDDGSQYMGK